MRFYGLVAIVFVVAFAGVSWAARGFPVGQDVATLLLGKPSAPREHHPATVPAQKLDPCDPAARVQLAQRFKAQMAENGGRPISPQVPRNDAVAQAARTAEIMSSDIPRMLAQIRACVPDAPFP
jgi:hypothetical protein